MRHMGLTWIAIAGLTVLGAPIAEAGVTCKFIPSWCPTDNVTKSTSNTVTAGNTSSVGKTSVPEPATLFLLGAGVSAVGVAMRRRRKD